jgi:hypothetical protein
VAVPPQKPPVDARAAQDSSGRQRTAGDELLDECAALEDEIEELKAKYEMYFLGVEKREPNRWREETRKKVLRIKEKFTRNTGLRFRIQSLHARFISYERLWMRSAREREEGTYRRDLFKAKLHARGGPPAPAQAGKAVAGAAARPATGAPPHEHHEGEDVDLSDFGDAFGDESPAAPPPALAPPVAAPRPGMFPLPGSRPAAKPAAPPSPATPIARIAAPPLAVPRPPAPVARAAAPPPAAPPSASGGAIADRQMRDLYDAYITAKKRCNEDTSRLTFEAVSASVKKQLPEIEKQYKAKSVEFKVVIKDGKAKLTAVPKS